MLPLALFLATNLTPRTATDYSQPQLAASEKTVVVAFGSGSRIYFAKSVDKGKTFTEPTEVANVPGLMLGNHRGPRVAFSRETVVISAAAAGDLLSWRSLDGGLTWRQSGRVNDQHESAREGLHAMVALPDGLLYAAWLDLRHVIPGQPGMELYGASSADGGQTWTKNALLYRSPDGSICTCCHPSLLAMPDGSLAVMWRNALGGNRDMYLAVSADRGATWGEANKLGGGSWALNACPMDGGSLAIGPNGKMVTTWRRGSDIYLAPATGAETLLHEGKNPSAAGSSSGLYVAWSGPDGIQARIPGQIEPVTLDGEGGFVQLTAIPNGPVIAAWERKGTLQFRTLP